MEMEKCKNIECVNETTGKRVYCSLTCRNVYVNKYLRNYDKYSKSCELKRNKKENEYLKNPKKCKNCLEVIPYDKRGNLYCGQSCSATQTNMKREVTWNNKISKGVKNYIDSNGYFGCLKMDKSKEIPQKECPNCNNTFAKKTKYCSKSCSIESRRVNTDEYQKYRHDASFKFNLSDYADEFDFSLVEKYGWYSPTNKNDNLGGISRDHMFSVREGFEKGIEPMIISHPANCRLMIHTENISKNKKSSITIEDLLNRIDKFNKKYKNKIIMEDLGAIS